MNIVYAVTNDYHEKIIPSMRSLLRHNPKAKVFIVTESDTVEGLPGKATVINVKDQKVFTPQDVNYYNAFTYINLMKVCYASILPCDKVLHLDVDTIVCDSLEPLWKTDLKGKWFAAVPEWRGHYNPFNGYYYNAGVLLLNLKQMRKDNAEEALVRYLKAFRQPYADQDSWNKMAADMDVAVVADTRFNECVPCGTTDHPAIVHYCGYKNWWEYPYIPRRHLLDEYKDA